MMAVDPTCLFTPFDSHIGRLRPLIHHLVLERIPLTEGHLQQRKSRPLTAMLVRFTQLGEIENQRSLLTAATLIVIAPHFIAFIFLQRQFIQRFLHSKMK
jgi:ABC-type maltose transport system permease subunit